MNLAPIKAFSALMKMGSTTRAAALMQISQPAVSRSVRRLEDTTKLKLFGSVAKFGAVRRDLLEQGGLSRVGLQRTPLRG
jgi:hypothetical protein